MLLFQYSLYWLTEYDQNLWRKYRFSLLAELFSPRTKALLGIAVVEFFWLATIYVLIKHMLPSGFLPEVNSPTFVAAGTGTALALYFFNCLIIGSSERIRHYKQIFKEWDSAKHARWKLYMFCSAFAGPIAFIVAVKTL